MERFLGLLVKANKVKCPGEQGSLKGRKLQKLSLEGGEREVLVLILVVLRREKKEEKGE